MAGGMSQIRTQFLALRMVMLWNYFRMRFFLGFGVTNQSWNVWYDLLSSLMRHVNGELRFMNFGYLPAIDTMSTTADEGGCQINLVRHTVTAGGRVDLAGKHLLEVGCGRGGGAAWIARNAGPAHYTAMDLSEENISACRNRFAEIPNLEFHVGDAAQLPFSDQMFDLVLNVESSHHYTDFGKFIAEVHRVLRPKGLFCIADFRNAEHQLNWERNLESSLLKIIDREDITESVVRAIEADHEKKIAAMAASGTPWLANEPLQQFLGCRGSSIHRSFAERKREYWRFVLERPN